jgi:hypothetical protein
MNPLIQFKKVRILALLIAPALGGRIMATTDQFIIAAMQKARRT